jgi:RHS repeat-associated protein
MFWEGKVMYPRNLKHVLVLLSALLFFSSDRVCAQAPTISGMMPTSGAVGMAVTLTGTNFGASQGSSTVSLNGTSAVVTNWSSASITAIVPTGATSGTFSVTVSSQTAYSSSFTVTALPLGWTDGDIGSVGVAGSASYGNGTFTVQGAGGGTLATSADGFNFVYQSLSGDGTIIARVVSTSGSGSQEAGVMIRETLSSDATDAQMLYYAGEGFNLTERTTTGSTSDGYISAQGVSVSPPYWVMLIRSGNTFSGYTSFDGESWLQVGSSETISMATNVYVGLYVTNRSTTALATGTFDSVSINSTASPGPTITSLSETTASVGTEVLITGSSFGATQNGGLVTLNGSLMPVNSWTDTGIVFTVPSGATTGPLLVSVAPSMNDSNAVILEITSQPLTSPWVDEDIGPVGELGSASYANSVFTVKGAGAGTLVNTADGIHFVYQPLSGDGTIVARIVSTSGGGQQEAGVMIRETLDPGATNVQTFYYANSAGLNLSERTSTGATSDGYASSQAISGAPAYWVMLVRSSNTFSGYASLDGVNWRQIGSSETITMATNVYVGLYVSNRTTSSLATATFDGVSLATPSSPAPAITSVSVTTGSAGGQIVIAGSGFGATQSGSAVTLNDTAMTINSWSSTSIVATVPSGATSGPLMVSVAPTMNNSNPIEFAVTSQPLPTSWLDQDVGSTGLLGSATYSSGVFTITGAGMEIYGSSDDFHFAYLPLSGDGTIIARVVSLLGPAGYIAAGVMMRNTLDPASMNLKMAEWPTYGGIYLDVRSSNGGSTSEPGSASVTLPYWVKLVRSGSTFYGYTSADGSTWTQMGSSQTISMSTNILVGLAVTSGSATSFATATFDNVSVTVGSTPFVTGISPNLGGAGASVTIAGSNFGATQGTSTVTFNTTNATTITSWNNAQVIATVPSGATTGLVTVTVGGVQSPSSSTFTVINPTITSLTPPAAQALSFITISGSGFGASQSSSQVQFNGVAATATSWSDTSIIVSVPSSASSGPVTVIRDGVTSSAVSFTLLGALTVTGLSTTSGDVGSTITITGTGFGPSQSNSEVVFYPGVAASVNSWSDTQIVATIPVAYSGPVGVGVATEYVFGPTFNPTSTANLTDSLGNQTTYTSEQIAGRWLPLSVQGSGCSSCSLRGTISYTYDSYGNALSRTDENGNITTYTYDSNGNVLTVTAPITSSTTATTTYTYNSLNEVLTATDPLGNVTTNTYDSHGNLTSVTTPAPNGSTAASVTSFGYNSLGELTTITDPLSNATTLTYTSAGLISTITDAQSNVTTYAYDSHGNRTSVTDALSHQTTFTYDSMDRLTKITYPDSTTTQFGYDYRGRRTSVTDQNGKVTSYTYDDADRLLTVTDAASNVTTYAYDTEDNLTSIKDANSNTTSFTYDAFGRVTKTTFPSTLTETYSYDAVGNLTGKTDRKGQAISYTYDQLNRLTQKTYPDTTTVNYTYDNDSRLTQVVDPTGTYSFTFDNMGRLTATTTSYSFLTSRTFTTAYSYDAASNRTGFTDPESGSSTYAYDTLNRLQTLTPPSAISSGNFGLGYDALSRRTSLTRPNSVNTSYSYDNLSRLLSVTHAKSGTTLDGASYTVDNAGNRTAKTDQRASVTSNYTYDAIYELTQVTQSSTTTESYSFDPVGNRTASLGVSTYTNNSSNELTSTSSASYTYDNNGNTLTKVVGSNTTQYFWDYENRMSSVTLPGSGGTVSFKYDPFGRRIYKSSSSGTSVFAYDGDNLVEETNSSGTAIARYSQGLNIDEPLAMLRSSTTSFYQADGLGSITSLSNTTGSLAQTYTFDSFGNQTASSGSLTNPFQYTARESDPETGLYYYRARYYDPTAGRFLTEDPLEFGGSGPNFYTYVFNSAINLLDPTGLLPGQKYQSLECAGWHAIRDINQTSRHRSPAWPHGREYGGWMYKNSDGSYSYTAPVPGGPAGVSPSDFRPIPRRAHIAGDYHTHGAYDPADNTVNNLPNSPNYQWQDDGNEIFSDSDKLGNEQEHGPGFLGTPQGTTEEYIPRPGHRLGGRVVVLSRSPCGCE